MSLGDLERAITRQLFIVFVFVCSAFEAPAQEYRFAGIEWGSGREEVTAVLESRGYVEWEPVRHRLDRAYQATHTVSGYEFYVMARFTPSDRLVRWRIVFDTDRLDCLSFYEEMRGTLTEKYGEADFEVRRFPRAYEGSEETRVAAIARGRGTIGALWIGGDGGDLTINVTPELDVVVIYESEEWRDEYRRRERAARADF